MSVIFEPRTYPKKIVLVGAGGTGAQWARSMARILWDMRERRLHVPDFVIVDPDRVEEKNVGRQLFAPADCGQYKAEVLARRFSYALGLKIAWRNEPFDAQEFKMHWGEVLFCGAVDNHEARAAIAEAIAPATGHPAVWIDAGNDRMSGQVIIGNTDDPERVVLREKDCDRLPIATLLFPQLLEPEPETTLAPDASCAELMEAGVQHLLINDLMATVAAQYSYRLLHRQPITSFITYVDLATLGMRSLEINRENLEAYLDKVEETVERRDQVLAPDGRILAGPFAGIAGNGIQPEPPDDDDEELAIDDEEFDL
jgi:PRTRC genetic system ThiF family protein